MDDKYVNGHSIHIATRGGDYEEVALTTDQLDIWGVVDTVARALLGLGFHPSTINRAIRCEELEFMRELGTIDEKVDWREDVQ